MRPEGVKWATSSDGGEPTGAGNSPRVYVLWSDPLGDVHGVTIGRKR